VALTLKSEKSQICADAWKKGSFWHNIPQVSNQELSEREQALLQGQAFFVQAGAAGA